MCQFKYTHHSCGHTLPKLEEPNDPSCKLCVPVLVALTYYHDQPTQICVENSFQQPPKMPRPCRPVGPECSRNADDLAHTYAQDLAHFEGVMDQLGVSVSERQSIEELARRSNQTSKRNTNLNVPLTPFSPRKFQFLIELEEWQRRPYQPPNITFNTVAWGCGGTGPGVQSDCLVGWTGQGILMYRHGVWNGNPLHHWDPQSPPAVGFLRIDYGDAPLLQLPERWRASATRTSIDIPMSTCLYAVLRGRSPGPLVYDDEGYLVPALGASGPDIPTGLHLQPRPTQVFAPPEHPHHAQERRHPAPYSSSTSITRAAGGPRPSQPYKQRSNKRYGHSKTEAGPSQQVDRAEINTKIKQLPQRRASRSGTTTPATIAPAGVSQPLHSTHPTPRSTTPATTAGNAPPSDNPPTGLNIIDESPPAASPSATNDDVEETILYQPPRHRTPHPSEGKQPLTPTPLRRHHSTHELSRSHTPPSLPLSNIPIDAAGEGQPQTQETSRPELLVQDITQSTSQMARYAARMNANAQQQQRVPGVEYTLNPTARAFAPGSSSERGKE